MAAGLLAPAVSARAFDFRSTQPAFAVRVPGVPAVAASIEAAPGPGAPEQASGTDGRYRVEVITSKADKRAITTRECAGRALRGLVSRPGMPNRDSIYRAPLDAQTFLVIYEIASDGATRELHAHLLAAVGGTHCVEAHISRPASEGEDEDDWRSTFRDARIEDGSH